MIRVKVSFYVDVPEQDISEFDGDEDYRNDSYIEAAFDKLLDEKLYIASSGEIIGPVD